MVDEIAVPDRLEQAVGEAEGEDVLRRLLAEKMVDAENLVLAEDLVQVRVELLGAFEVDAKGLFHDHPRACDEVRLGKQPHRRKRRARRHAEIMQAPGFRAERLFRALYRARQRRRALRQRNIVQELGEFCPIRLHRLARRVRLQRAFDQLAESLDVDRVERDADHPAGGNEVGGDEMEQGWPQLALGEVAGAADEHQDMRILGADARIMFRQFVPPVRFDAGVGDHDATLRRTAKGAPVKRFATEGVISGVSSSLAFLPGGRSVAAVNSTPSLANFDCSTMSAAAC